MLGQDNFKVVELHSCLSEFDTISNRLDHQPLFEKRAGTPLPNPLLREELKPLIKALSQLFWFSLKCFIFLHTYTCRCRL